MADAVAAAGSPALFTPPDVEPTYREWRANCGPAALAAVTRKPVMSLRLLFPHFPARPWTNPTHMRQVLDTAAVGHLVCRGWPW